MSTDRLYDALRSVRASRTSLRHAERALMSAIRHEEEGAHVLTFPHELNHDAPAVPPMPVKMCYEAQDDPDDGMQDEPPSRPAA